MPVPIGNTDQHYELQRRSIEHAMAGSAFDNVEFSVCTGDYAHDTLSSTNYPEADVGDFARTDLNTQSIRSAGQLQAR